MRSFAALPYLVLQWLRQAAINARRRDRTGRYLVWSALAGLASAAMLVLAAAFASLLWWAGLWYLALAMVAVLIVPVVAGPLIRTVLVPAGWHRLAFHAAQYSRPGTDPVAYALCVAAWASRTPSAAAWVEAQRDARGRPLGDAEIAATALLAAGRGDVATARELLRSLAMIVENHPAVRELAGEWLACDAAERGAWDELVATAARGWPATPLGFLLEGIAARHTGAAGAPSANELWGRWLLAPRRRTTHPLVLAALAAAPAPAPREAAGGAADPAPSEPAAPGSPLPGTAAAVAAHLAVSAAPITVERLTAAVRAWDAALADPTTRAWLARRALELDAPAGAVDRALHDVAGAVTDDLARRAEAAQLGAPPGPHGPVSSGLARLLRHGRLDALEAAFARWADRRHDGAAAHHPAIDEWREFVALWTAYNAAVAAGGLELRRLAFPHAFGKGSNMAAWLWNKRDEYAVSHAISKWLLDEALAVGDTEAIELGHRNCALSVPTRLGRITS
jgi:hypothetical protein